MTFLRALVYTGLTLWSVSELTGSPLHWPVRPRRGGVPRRVNGKTIDGERDGVSAERWFGAPRQGGRKHAGVDLLARPGDEIVAIEDGFVVKHLGGYVGLDAIAIASPEHVLVYAELDSEVEDGRIVRAGDRIGRAKKSSQGTQLHIEMWDVGSTPESFTPWVGSRPDGLHDPTQFLLSIG